MEDVFRVVDGLEKKVNEGDKDGATKVPFDIKDQQLLGDCHLKMSTMNIVLTQLLWRM